ncbi:carbon storage regulator CsrA [Paenibacillus ginsengihumi]|uniref:carbon storage regulator CsrA n=1 Tax=Paenibacillus ginsengihumi TaxID=431596 RepID=UPI000377572F|nr:carbon storage regulator CsrA [Paenibacillus ginsengihumi]
MLVLSRKTGESIMIGDQVELVILGTERDQVKIGIRAPRHLQVFRKEIYAMLKETNEEASQSRVDQTELAKLLKNKEK